MQLSVQSKGHPRPPGMSHLTSWTGYVWPMHPIAADWFPRRTWGWRDWPAAAVLAAKGETRVSVVLPALDEEPTVGEIETGVLTLGPLVDELIVIDSGSVDRTADVARAAGATVHHRDDILPA